MATWTLPEPDVHFAHPYHATHMPIARKLAPWEQFVGAAEAGVVPTVPIAPAASTVTISTLNVILPLVFMADSFRLDGYEQRGARLQSERMSTGDQRRSPDGQSTGKSAGNLTGNAQSDPR